MRPLFSPRLVNGPFDDPVLLVRLDGERGSLLFDLGDMSTLTAGEVMRITDVFVTHTHIDHFIGFDTLLRIVLGRDKRVCFHGPAGIIRQVRGKLRGYTWNLVENYRLELEVREFGGRVLRRRLFTCRDRFRHEEDLGSRPAPDGVVAERERWRVRAIVLEHRTPCLGYLLEEKAPLAVDRVRLEALGLAVGPWLAGLKRLFAAGRLDEMVTAARAGVGRLDVVHFSPRYQGEEHLLRDEAQAAFRGGGSDD
jgi:ribonuclease Z